MLLEMGTLAGKVLNLKRLDQVVLELKDQVVIHFERGESLDAQKLFDERFHREKSASSFTNTILKTLNG